MYRKGSYFLARALAFVAVLLMAALLAVQLPSVQTALVKKAAAILEEKTQARIEVGSVSILPINTLIANDVLILDPTPYEDPLGYRRADTLLHIRNLNATFSFRSLLGGGGIKLRRAVVNGASLNLTTEEGGSNISRLFHSEKKGKGGLSLAATRVEVNDFHFRLINFKKAPLPEEKPGTDWANLDVKACVKARNISFANGIFDGVAEKVTLWDHRGFGANLISCDCRIGNGKTVLSKLHFDDGCSDLYCKYYSMNYGSVKGLANYIDETRMELAFDKGWFAMETVYRICGCDSGRKVIWKVSDGMAQGYVNDLHVKDFRFKDLYSGVSGLFNGSITGLPDINFSSIDTHVILDPTDAASLNAFALAWSPGAKYDFSKLEPGRRFIAEASTRGILNDFGVSCRISEGKGRADARLNFSDLLKTNAPIVMRLSSDTRDFDLSALTGKAFLGPVSATGKATSVFRNGTSGLFDFDIDTLGISSITLDGREYRDISASGRNRGGSGGAELHSRDKGVNLDAEFTRTAGSQRSGDGAGTTLSTLKADIPTALLSAFGLDEWGDAALSCRVDGSLSEKDSDGAMNGTLSVTDVVFTENSVPTPVEDLQLSMESAGDGMDLRLTTPFADASYSGSNTIAGIIGDIRAITIDRELPALQGKGPKKGDGTGKEYAVDMDFHDTRPLLSLLKPGLFIADSSSVHISVDRNGTLTGDIKSGRLAYNGAYIKDARITLDNHYSQLRAVVNGSELKAGNLIAAKPMLNTRASGGKVYADLESQGLQGDGNISEIHIRGEIGRSPDDSLTARFNPEGSFINIGKDSYTFSDSEFSLNGHEFQFDGFRIDGPGSSLILDGGITPSGRDTLTLALDNFDISVLNGFLAKNSALDGRISGKADILSPSGDALKASARFDCDSLSISGALVGRISLNGNWDKQKDSLYAHIVDESNGKRGLYAEASYKPSRKEIDADVVLDAFQLAPFAPFLKETFTELGGSISGEVTANGPLDKIRLGSNGMVLEDAKMRLAATGAVLTANGPVRVNDNSLYLDSIKITDDSSGKGTLIGSIYFNESGKPELDASIDIDRIKVVDSEGEGPESVYGKMYASGKAVVSGPFNALRIEADVATIGNGEVHIPLNTSSTNSRSDLLECYEEEVTVTDPYEDMMKKSAVKLKSKSNIDFHARARVSREQTLVVELNKANGMVATVGGSGLADISLNPARGILNVEGDYNIDRGNFHFAVPGLLEKDFSIDNGSRINFVGDVKESILDVSATHSLRTSLTNILADTTAVSSRRAVNCILSITDRLKDPKLGFKIDIPDLDPTTKSQVESALNTPDKLEQQFFSLLLIGTFAPTEQYGVIDRNNMLISNFSEVMSSQINSILQKLNVPLNLGFEYEQNGAGNNTFGVNASANLLDDRMTVSGQVGNKRYSNSSSATGDIVGDLDAEYKLGRNGNFRIHLFSHSANELSSYLDLSQRYGGGLTYQKEFNSFWKFLGRMFVPRSKRAEGRHERQRETTTMEIGGTQ
ncbi:MAG: translocation/assembly module TamB [Bacteroidales bacterium]|nr:translocation/assembly module TamB [Bacteroidales bacterium]